MNKQIEKWKQKSVFGKVSDIIFLIFLVALFIPQSRLAIGGFVNRIKAKIMQPEVIESSNLQTLTDADYNWKLVDVNGNAVSFAEAKGKVIFVNKWATWCPPCVGEMPEIQSLYNEFKDNPKIAFYLVSNETTDKIKLFTEKHGYNFPVYTQATFAPQILQSETIPTTFIIDKNGNIVVKESGAANWGSQKTIKIINDLIDM